MTMTYGYSVAYMGKPPTSHVTGFATRERMMAQIVSRFSLSMGELIQLCREGYLYLREAPVSTGLSTNCITTFEQEV
jgi:hypothetical protein